MESVADRLLTWLGRLEQDVDILLLQHSGIWLWNQPGGPLAVITGTPYAWKDLNAQGRNLQSRLLNEYSHWVELTNAVLAGTAESIINDVATAQADLREVIDQSASTHHENIGMARQGATDSVAQLRKALVPLLEASSGPPLLVPDTNALLYEPRLEEWQFDTIPEFEIVLLPTVLGELDELKVNYRRESVRDKAEQLIRQIKRYRARGRLTDGVPLRKGRSSIKAVATEPKRERLLSWLDWDSADDRILAAVLEVMRHTPGQAVACVTRDKNLQNKAEFARIPYLEPPKL